MGELSTYLSTTENYDQGGKLETCFSKPREFKSLDVATKVECLKYLIKRLKVNDPVILAEFYDFLAIGSLEKDFNYHVGIVKEVLEDTLEKYFDPDDASQPGS